MGGALFSHTLHIMLLRIITSKYPAMYFKNHDGGRLPNKGHIRITDMSQSELLGVYLGQNKVNSGFA